MRVLCALGGNALSSPDGRARPEDQIAAAGRAAEGLADLVAAGHELVVTHGNGPQVGNLLVKNELAAAVVPPVPLDWCVAQTQATIGVILSNALERGLRARDAHRPVAALVTRTLVHSDDPGMLTPTKPIGRYLPRDEAQVLIDHGEVWRDFGTKGWRRVVASPEPQRILDVPAVRAMLASGYVVIAGGGGGVPVVEDSDGALRGVEAVIDKDLAAAGLGEAVEADVLLIATDVPHVLLGYGSPSERPLRHVTRGELQAAADAGEFAAGSMAPKVEAALRFVRNTGRNASICSLDDIVPALAGAAGTHVTPDVERNH
ncbi:carbamate kinase [Nocardioides sp. CER19]|uniref:carbamate kinase n=1 Tax=Nocardioides sp. CER19 TaxID=3038538 RepID=UPI00244A6259|nr:carbamate kinase [Nocardioides sp. CER19]MDH2415189.1 carbamate kinase [Nocardioides sp. CER19]